MGPVTQRCWVDTRVAPPTAVPSLGSTPGAPGGPSPHPRAAAPHHACLQDAGATASGVDGPRAPGGKPLASRRDRRDPVGPAFPGSRHRRLAEFLLNLPQDSLSQRGAPRRHCPQTTLGDPSLPLRGFYGQHTHPLLSSPISGNFQWKTKFLPCEGGRAASSFHPVPGTQWVPPQSLKSICIKRHWTLCWGACGGRGAGNPTHLFIPFSSSPRPRSE